MDMDKNDMEYKSERSHLFGLFSIFTRFSNSGIIKIKTLIEIWAKIPNEISLFK